MSQSNTAEFSLNVTLLDVSQMEIIFMFIVQTVKQFTQNKLISTKVCIYFKKQNRRQTLDYVNREKYKAS